VQVPTQPLLAAAALVDEVVAVQHQQLQFAQALLARTRPIQVRLPQRRPRRCERVDRVRLAAPAAGTPLGRGQSRRHPHEPLARGDQLALERAAHMTAVLDRPQALAVERRRPGEQPLLAAGQRPLGQQPPALIDGGRRQRLLVHVHSDHDHGIASYRWGRPASGQASLEAAAKLLSGHARRSREGGGDTTLASRQEPTVRNGVSRRHPESLAQAGRHRQPRMTVSSGMTPEREASDEIEAKREWIPGPWERDGAARRRSEGLRFSSGGGRMSPDDRLPLRVCGRDGFCRYRA